MSLLQSILMGIIQGATEFLPVSSSGHLALFKIIFNVNTETGRLLEGCPQSDRCRISIVI